jgi:hypothetical protein
VVANQTLLSECTAHFKTLVRQRLDAKSKHRVYRATLLGVQGFQSIGSERSVRLQEPFLVPFEGFEALAPTTQGHELALGSVTRLFL